jgi:hypothetical protein
VGNLLKAAFCLPMARKEVAFFRTIAGDRDPPKKQVKGCGLLAADVATKTRALVLGQRVIERNLFVGEAGSSPRARAERKT